MTDVTTSENQEPAGLSAADEQVLRELTGRARAGWLQLTGEGGLLDRLTKMVGLTRVLVRIPSRAGTDPYGLVLGCMSSWLAGHGSCRATDHSCRSAVREGLAPLPRHR